MEILAIIVCLALVPFNANAVTMEGLERENRLLKEELAGIKMILSEMQIRLEDCATQKDVSRFLVKLNDTEDLEARVTVLEDSMMEIEGDIVALQDDMEDTESINILQEDRLNTIETELLDNDEDIEALDDATNGLQLQVSDLQDENFVQDARLLSVENDIVGLDERVTILESGGGNVNVTDLTERVEALEEVTSQMSGDISELQGTTEDFEARITELESVIIEPWEACLSSPCDNDGTCIDVNVDTFICACSDGYFGLTCSDSYSSAAFLAGLESTVDDDPDPLIFTWERINPGCHYNTETGKYTVPYDGIYQFSVYLQDATSTRILIEVDDSYAEEYADGYDGQMYRSVTILLELTAGQTVHVYAVGGALGRTSYLRSFFSGHLISAN